MHGAPLRDGFTTPTRIGPLGPHISMLSAIRPTVPSHRSSLDLLRLRPEILEAVVERENELVVRFTNGDQWFIFGDVEEAIADTLRYLANSHFED